MQKPTSIIVLGIALVAGLMGYYRFNSFQESQTELLSNYQQQLEQLLADSEESSRMRLDLESQIAELQSELVTLNSQLTSSANELQLAEQRSNPDSQALEREIRQRVDVEYQQYFENSDSRINLVRQLSLLAPEELGSLMALQSQYGEFLDSLDVSDQRLDEIVTALSDMMAEQNQARRELAMSARVQQGDPRDMQDLQEQMMALSSPAALRQALALDLSEEELDLFSEFQAQQPSPFYTGRLQRGARDGRAIFLGNEQGRGATFQAQPISPPNPRN